MRLLREFAGYGLASAAALVVDTGLLVYLVRYCAFGAVFAASLSFCAGAVVAYLLSVKLAFATHRFHNRRIEFVIFFAVGLVGLAINAAVIAAASWLGIDIILAKAGASGATFCCNFLLRRYMLFMVPRDSRNPTHVCAE